MKKVRSITIMKWFVFSAPFIGSIAVVWRLSEATLPAAQSQVHRVFVSLCAVG